MEAEALYSAHFCELSPLDQVKARFYSFRDVSEILRLLER